MIKIKMNLDAGCWILVTGACTGPGRGTGESGVGGAQGGAIHLSKIRKMIKIKMRESGYTHPTPPRIHKH